MPRQDGKRRRQRSHRAQRSRRAEEDRVVTVYETERIEKVAMLRMALDDAGIPYITANDVVSAVLPFNGMVMVRFQVLEEDLERAYEVLRELGFS